MYIEDVKVFLITDDKRSRGRRVEEVVEAAVSGGIRGVQYRPWNPLDRDFLSKARTLRRITAAAGALLIINDRADIAALSQADGVHLGSGDIPVNEAIRLLGEDSIIGYSAHTSAEVEACLSNFVSYATYSPVFQTSSTCVPRKPKGIEDFIETSALVHIPVFALGGIDYEKAGELLVAGARNIAVVSAVTEADDVEAAARALCTLMGQE